VTNKLLRGPDSKREREGVRGGRSTIARGSEFAEKTSGSDLEHLASKRGLKEGEVENLTTGHGEGGIEIDPSGAADGGALRVGLLPKRIGCWSESGKSGGSMGALAKLTRGAAPQDGLGGRLRAGTLKGKKSP